MSDHELDLERRKRTGFSEVVFAPGKSAAQLRQIIEAMRELDVVIATRVSTEQAASLEPHFPDGRYDSRARVWTLGSRTPKVQGRITIATAGTTDLPTAYEARAVTTAYGHETTLIADVGVAGIHRILEKQKALQCADVVIVVAGMDGALPSVVGGLVRAPVIAVPTSVGYGAAFEGLAALLTMLNSCAPGVTVVNIDNGFGAAYAACQMIEKLKAQP